MNDKHSAVLIDNEPHNIQFLKALLGKYCPHVEVKATATHANDGMEMIALHRPNLVFADITMPSQQNLNFLANGSQAAYPFYVVFTSTHHTHAFKAIKLNALDYLLKPFDKNELIGAIDKLDKSTNASTATQYIPSKVPGVVAVASVNGLEFVKTTDIVMMEADSCYTNIYTVDNNKQVVTKTLQYFEEILDPCGLFFRVHKSFLVNLQCIKSYTRGDGGDVLLTNGKTVSLSKHRKQEFLSLFMR